jgi:hypothetical protein
MEKGPSKIRGDGGYPGVFTKYSKERRDECAENEREGKTGDEKKRVSGSAGGFLGEFVQNTVRKGVRFGRGGV